MADIKTAYASSAALTITLASLGTNSSLVVGRESTSVDNTSNKYLDYPVAGKITTGTSPTAGVIEVWAYGQLDDTPTYSDSFTGTDNPKTMTTRDILLSGCAWIATLVTTATTNVTYWFGPVSLACAFSRLYGGGILVPKKWGLFVTHNTAVNLNSTGSNHACWHTGVYMTSV